MYVLYNITKKKLRQIVLQNDKRNVIPSIVLIKKQVCFQGFDFIKIVDSSGSKNFFFNLQFGTSIFLFTCILSKVHVQSFT